MNDVTYRSYDPERDEKAVIRIWRECGWPDLKKNRRQREVFRKWTAAGSADVAEFRGEAECLVNTHRGTMRLLDEELPFRGVSSVTVGRPLRRLGGAGELTARAVARAAEEGDAIAALGIFDQGFYDKLGFGSFPYIRTIAFDPASLDVPPLTRPPVRLTRKDLPRIVQSINNRMPHHGRVRFEAPEFHEMMMVEHENSFGLGFEDEKGRLTHHFWADARSESGPYSVHWMAYRNYDQLIELLSLMHNLSDQVLGFIVREPWGIQFQDFLKRPFRNHDLTEGGKFESRTRATAYKQARILDMEKSLAALKLPGGTVKFNLDLDDPIRRYLPKEASWKGLSGSRIVELRPDGSIQSFGRAQGLPEMKASVSAFTRLIFGVATPAGLAASDSLTAPAELLDELTAELRLPEPDMAQIF